MKKGILCFLLFAVFTAVQSFASDFNDGTLNYTIIKDAGGAATTNVQVDGLVNTSTTSITIPATVTSNNVTYNVTSIGGNAFNGCSGLTTFDISGATNLTTIGAFAFYSSGLTSVTIPASVTSIGESAFSLCSKLASIDLSKATALQAIGDFAFQNSIAATFITTTGSPATAVKYNALTSIGEHAFQLSKGLTTFDISGATNLTAIGADAFFYCTGLTSITIPSSVTSIGDLAFYNCSGLNNLDISGATNLTTIGVSAFRNCSAATFITTTGSPATAVKYDALTSIGAYAFNSCSGLTTFDISGATNLTTIGDYAFRSCSGLTSVTIPASVTSIGYDAFYDCSGLTSIDLSKATGLQTIGASAFKHCSAAKFITTTGTPATQVKYNTLTSIGDNAFSGCKLTSFDISGATNLTTIGEYAFSSCSGLTSVTIPASVTSIENYTFYNCTGLTSVTIPASVTSIGERAFYNCSNLTSVTIPASVTSIGNSAFFSCTRLSTVYLEPTTPPSLGTDIFAYCNKNIKFYINDGTTGKAHISAYISATSAWTSGKIIDSNAVPYLPKKVTEAKVATLYLPYQVDIPDGITAYYCSGKATDYISMTKLEGGVIPANTPVYLTATDAATFNFIANGKSTPAVTKDDILKGLTADLTVITGNTYLTLGKASDDTYGFYKYKGTTIAANTCYIEYSGGSAAKGFNISFDGSTTGINEAAAPANAGKRMIYDLQGRRVTSPVKGIYIINGKKVIF